MKKSRTVIIGIDGAPFSLMERLSRDAVMPNFRELREEGIFKRMDSSIPDISSVSWSSIVTGKNPGEHGIFGFTEMIEGTYTLRFPDFRGLMAPPFWNSNEAKNVIINTPFTYPAQGLNGVLISGFVAPDMERAVYPKEYLPQLKGMGYRIDVDAAKGHRSKSLLLKDLLDILDARVRAYRHFWKAINWDTFMLVFTGSDRLGHFLWDALEELEHKYHEDFLEFFRRVDWAIGDINSRLGPEDNLVMLSDHGMERIEATLDINSILAEKGFLVLGNSPGKRYGNIKPGTTAFALDPGRIYLNREGKYPGGSVRRGDEESILEDLVSLFNRLKIGGKKAVGKVHRREEIYWGEFAGKGPDLVLAPNPGFNLRGTLSTGGPVTDSGLTGKHNPEAFLFVKGGRRNAVPENPCVENVVGILKALEERK